MLQTMIWETVVSRRFMRGTDPIKSTWVYPKLISNSYYLYSKISITDTIFSIVVLITLLIFNFYTKRLAGAIVFNPIIFLFN